MAGVQSVTMDWDFSELAAMGQRYATANAIVVDEMRQAVEWGGYAVEGKAKGYAPTGQTKTLRRQIGLVKPLDTSVPGRITGIVRANTDYARAIEFNWKSQTGKWPPKGALISWMQYRGIPEQYEYVIRRAIARRGYKDYPNPRGARPYLTRALAELIPAISDRMQQVPDGIFRRMAAMRP